MPDGIEQFRTEGSFVPIRLLIGRFVPRRFVPKAKMIHTQN